MGDGKMLILSFIFYFGFASIFRKRLDYQLHSILHCINSVVLTTYFFTKYDMYFFYMLYSLNTIHDEFIHTCIYHSLGYFIADTVDIVFFDRHNIKRKKYILHHLIAIIGLSMIYLGSNYPIFAIWCLEIGGLVHHIKTVYPPAKILYFIIYPMSRIYFIFNVFQIPFTYFSFADFISFSTSFILTIQNVIWLYRNYISM